MDGSRKQQVPLARFDMPGFKPRDFSTWGAFGDIVLTWHKCAVAFTRIIVIGTSWLDVTMTLNRATRLFGKKTLMMFVNQTRH